MKNLKVALSVACAVVVGWVFTASADIPASAYVQDGLIAQYDGIDNAGTGTHDPTATTWKDLVGANAGAYDMTLTANGSFTDMALVSDGKKTAAKGTSPAVTIALIEGCFTLDSDKTANSVLYATGLASGGNMDWCIGLLSSHRGYLFGGNTPMFAVGSNYSGFHTISSTKTVCFYDGSSDSVTKGANNYFGNTTARKPGTAAVGGFGDGDTPCAVKMHSIRLYSRALTAVEMAYNASIDKLRFSDVDPEGLGYRWNSDEGKLQCRVRVTGDELGGTVSIAGGEPTSGVSEEWVYGDRQAVSIIATPADGYVFCGWTGDTDDFTFGQYRSPSIAVAGRVRTLRAEFRLAGTNVHGIPGNFSSLAEALASPLVKDGDTIQLADDTHVFAQEATVGSYTYLAKIDRFVTVRGSSPDNVVLDCGGGGGLYIDHPAALVEGVTIQNFQRTSSTFALDFQRGVVSNACVNGSSGKCMKVEGSIPAIRSFEGALFTDCVVTNINKQNWDSSGAMTAAGATVRRTTFYGNKAYNYILRVEARNGVRARVEDCTFANNNDYYRPMIHGSNVDVVDCVFYGNSSSDAGAGLSLSGTCTFDRCVVTNNTLNGSCPLVACAASAVVAATNCLFARNSIAKNGAFRLGGASARIELVNTTVANNATKAAGVSGGFSGDGTAAGRGLVRAVNTIIWGNTSNGEVADFAQEGGYPNTDFALDNCCFANFTSTSGGNNVDKDPMFANATAGDFTLGDGTSCIDRGEDLPAVAVDLSGKDRPIDGDGDGLAAWDIGCYEADAPTIPLQATLHTFGETGTYPCEMTQTVSVVGSKMTNLTYEWLAIRAEGDKAVTNVQHTTVSENVFRNLEPGQYSFEVIVRNDQGDAASDAVHDAFLITFDTCYVSSAGSDTWPYTNAAMAAHQLSAAAAIAGRRVVIAPGEYAFEPVDDAATGKKYMAAFRRAVSVEGADDPTDVVLDCGGQGGLLLDNLGASVRGLTFKNFHTANEAGQALYLMGASASNIVFKGGSGKVGSDSIYIGERSVATDFVVSGFNLTGGKPVVHLVGGTIARSKFSGNVNNSDILQCSASNGGYRNHVRGCTFLQNAVSWGYATQATQTDIADCTYIGNNDRKVGYDTIAFSSSTVSNCVFACNTGIGTVRPSTVWGTYDHLITDCLIVRNTNTTGGAVNMASASCTAKLLNCTIADNVSNSGNGGGVSGINNTSAVNVYLDNCIVWGNTTNGVPCDVTKVPNKVVPSTSCFLEAADYPDKGNIAADPKFRKGTVVVGGKPRYTLRGGSPCIDSGARLGWTDNDTDLAGNPRILYDEKGDGQVDMGCYECPNVIYGMRIFVR